MRSGLLNKRVELWRKNTTKNSFGELSESWFKVKELRAYTYRKSGRDSMTNDEMIDLNKIRIQVRNQHTIWEQDRVKYNNQMYKIELLQPLDIKERFLMIYCTRINE